MHHHVLSGSVVVQCEPGLQGCGRLHACVHVVVGACDGLKARDAMIDHRTDCIHPGLFCVQPHTTSGARRTCQESVCTVLLRLVL